MTGNVERQIGTRGVVDCGTGQGNQGMVPLEFGCTIKLILESTVRDNASAVIWLGHVFVVTKVRIQISGWVVWSCYRKKIGNKTTVILCLTFR